MTGEIFIDSLVPSSVREPKVEWTCHLFAGPGDLHKLHAFAIMIGLSQSQFIPSQVGDKLDTLPHYVLDSAKRWRAESHGAIRADKQKTIQVMNYWNTAVKLTR